MLNVKISSSYPNYLCSSVILRIMCSVLQDDDDHDDDDDDDDDDDGQSVDLELAALIGTTTCRADSNDNSCYSSIAFNPTFDQVEAAFVS